MTPREAFDLYNDKEAVAMMEYRDYWKEKFKQAGLGVIQPTVGYRGALELVFKGTTITAYVGPTRYEGIKLHVSLRANRTVLYPYWTEIKIKSETGLNKFIRRLRAGEFS